MIETSRYAGIVIIIEPNRYACIIYTKPSRCASIIEAKSLRIGSLNIFMKAKEALLRLQGISQNEMFLTIYLVFCLKHIND